MPKTLYSYIITFGIALANRNPVGRNFTGRRMVTWHAPLQTIGAKREENGDEKTHFAKFSSPKQRVVPPTSQRTIAVEFEHKTW